jgi:hypothetical protein
MVNSDDEESVASVKTKVSWQTKLKKRVEPEPIKPIVNVSSELTALTELVKRDSVRNIRTYKTQLQKISRFNKTGIMPENFLGNQENKWFGPKHESLLIQHKNLNEYLYRYLEKLNLNTNNKDPNIP